MLLTWSSLSGGHSSLCGDKIAAGSMSQEPPEPPAQGRIGWWEADTGPQQAGAPFPPPALERTHEYAPCAHLTLYDIVFKPSGLIGDPEHSHREGEVECHLEGQGVNEQSQGLKLFHNTHRLLRAWRTTLPRRPECVLRVPKHRRTPTTGTEASHFRA